MLIAGHCLYTHKCKKENILQTVHGLKGIATHFRIKLWGGGTTFKKYIEGVGDDGVLLLEQINKILPCGTEVRTPDQVDKCKNLDYLWIGARSSQNYDLLEYIAKNYDGQIFVKRGFGMTIDEILGIDEIMHNRYNNKIYIIERGINTFDRDHYRWSPDLKGLVRLKHDYPDLFSRTIVDCSHSAESWIYVSDIYKAFKSIGIQHFMFECYSDLKFSNADQNQAIVINELKNILEV